MSRKVNLSCMQANEMKMSKDEMNKTELIWVL